MSKKSPGEKCLLGWREWVSLPDLKINAIKAKVDTGARTSSLHAVNISYEKVRGKTYVAFDVHPQQRNTKRVVRCVCELMEHRIVTDSGGKKTKRPVVRTMLIIGVIKITIEVTLVPRDDLGFRMLLGRTALKNYFYINPAKSYLLGKVPH